MITSVIAESAAVLFGILSIAVNLPGVLGAASVEGILLAAGQAVLLSRRTGRLRAAMWIPATIAGALLGRVLDSTSM